MREDFPNKMQSKATWAIGRTWRSLMPYAGLSLWARSRCNGLGYHLQHLEKHVRPKDTYAWLIKNYVPNQDCILIIQNIIFSKIILCKPKLRWNLRMKCICQLTFILVFENVTWHFGFEVECQINLSNIHITFKWRPPSPPNIDFQSFGDRHL